MPAGKTALPVSWSMPAARATTRPIRVTTGFATILYSGTVATQKLLKMGLTDIPDGSDVTVLATENLDATKYVPTTSNYENELGFIWAAAATPPVPYRINQDKGKGSAGNINYARPSSNHNGVFNVVFASSQTKGISEAVDPRVWNQLCSPNGPKATCHGR
ncbi:MAG: hypothetical protein QM811_11765 [Pirellulales bacterium]